MNTKSFKQHKRIKQNKVATTPHYFTEKNNEEHVWKESPKVTKQGRKAVS
jgi:hypothetical protein